MSFPVNRIFSNISVIREIPDIPYSARDPIDIRLGKKENNDGRGYSGLEDYINRQVKITYLPRNAASNNDLKEIIDTIEFVSANQYYDNGEGHALNLVTLRLKDLKVVDFVDGTEEDLFTYYSQRAIGIIKFVQPV